MTPFKILVAVLMLPLMNSLAFAQDQSGNITVSQAWSRATPGGARNGSAFLQISAKRIGDRLVDAKSDLAEQVELHNHIHENGVMKMRRVDAVEIPAGETVELAPGGYHLMLMNIKRPLKKGETLDLTLVFEKAGEVPVTATIEPIGAKGPGSAGAGHGAAHGHGSGEHKH